MLGAGGLALIAAASRAAWAQSSPTPPQYYPADYKDIIEASKKEGKFVLYSNMSPKSWVDVKDRYSKLYPWINVQILDLDSEEMMERYLAEVGTNSATGDMLVSNAVEGWLNLAKRNEIQNYASPETKYFPAWSIPSPGLYTIAVDPIIILWNKAILKGDMVPKGIEDLARLVKANPGVFKGRVASFNAETQTLGYLSYKSFVDRYGDKAWEWFDVLGPSARAESATGTIVEKVLSGEYVAAYFSSSGQPWQTIKNPASAQLLGWTFIADGQPIILRSAAIMRKAPNPNAAKLWLDVTMSSEGQIGLGKVGRTPIRIDVKPSDVNNEFTYSSVVDAVGEAKIMAPAYDAKLFENRDQFIARWKKAFGRT
jgi:iron(III) transport system substrate-binding protein